jgi:hypothetical protein
MKHTIALSVLCSLYSVLTVQQCQPGLPSCPQPRQQYFSPPPRYEHYGPGQRIPWRPGPDRGVLDSINDVVKRIGQIEEIFKKLESVKPEKGDKGQRGEKGERGEQGPIGLQGRPGKDANTAQLQALIAALQAKIDKQDSDLAAMKQTLGKLQGKIRVRIDPQPGNR